VVSVAVNAGWEEEGGEAVEKLEGRETQGGAAGGVGLGQDVENLVRAAADEVETVESERGPRTVADQPLEAFAVGSLDADAPIQMMKEGPETFRHREDPLADGNVGKNVIQQVSPSLGHALGIAGRAGPSALA
jgi:hypothetical protein